MMPSYPIDDNYVSNFKFANGCIGRLLLILGAQRRDKFYVDLNVYGHEGSLRAVMQRNEIIKNMDRLEGDKHRVVPLERANSHALAIAHFVECVREDRQPMVNAVEGAKTVAVCLAAIRSAREGKPITVDYCGLP